MTEEIINESADIPNEAENESEENLGEMIDISDEERIGDESSEEISYEGLIESDLCALREQFPELSELSNITELENPIRYGALRDLGLSPAEAYRAITTRPTRRSDTRAHLKSAIPRHASSPASNMSYRELEIARSLFSGVSDSELQRLYKRVTR